MTMASSKTRRKFFLTAVSGLLGGFTLMRFVPSFLLPGRRRTGARGEEVSVTINPMAVPRRRKDERSDGT